MFDSHSNPTLDVKNRFFVPVEYRAELGTNVVLLPSPELAVKCVYIYNIDEWAIVRSRIKNGLPRTQRGRMIFRRILASVVPMDVDKAGRLTLNSELRTFAGITGKDIVVSGNENHLEVWSPENWAEVTEYEDDFSLDEFDIEL